MVKFVQNWLYSDKSGCIPAKLFYSGKSGCNRAKLFVRDIMVVFGQSCCILAKVVVFVQKWFSSGK